jgi:preprotein translocase subunit SecA
MSPAIGSFEKALRFGEGRRLKRLQEQAAYIATLEPDFQKLSDEALRGKTVECRERLETARSREPPVRGVCRRARGTPPRV